jgi:hypothetical protein
MRIMNKISNVFRKSKGCLFFKSDKEKNDYFQSLANFAQTDWRFFKEQYEDLLDHEQDEFALWLVNKHKNLEKISLLVTIIDELLKDKNHAKENRDSGR